MTTSPSTALNDDASGATAREAALREVLRIISGSRDDATPVFESILENAAILCSAPHALLLLRNAGNSHLELAGNSSAESAFIEDVRKHPHELKGDGSLAVQVLRSMETSNVRDIRGLAKDIENPSRQLKVAVEVEGMRSLLLVPLVLDEQAIGVLALYHLEVAPFSDDEVALIQSFAEQAVIAIENVRQFREVQTRLEREHASKEILDVISRSRDDEAPVFNIILENAARLCHAPHAFLMLRNEADTQLEFVAESFDRVSSIVDLKDHSYALDDENSLTIEALNAAQVRHVPDLLAHKVSYSTPMMEVAIEKEGMRTLLYVPLLKDGRALGLIGVYKHEVAPFNDGEIEMVQTFAAQAVIAIENVRQFRELQIRLEREEASREILQVISASRTDPAPVFEMTLKNATHLCGAPFANLVLLNEERSHWHLVAHFGDGLRHLTIGQATPMDSNLLPATAMRTARAVQIEDLTDTDLYRQGDPGRVAMADVEGMRTIMCVPLIRDAEAIGSITLFRREVKAFTSDEIELVETFAAQAVIAIENVRQFREVQERLEREEATSDVLKVISQSRDDEMPVFKMIQEHAARLCRAPFSGLFMMDKAGENLNLELHIGAEPNYVDSGGESVWPLSGVSAMARAVVKNKVINIDTLAETNAYRDGDPQTIRAVNVEKITSFLAVPLLSDGKSIGCIALYRTDPSPFTDDQVELVKTFAAQAVIAINNIKQFKALETLNAELGDRVSEQVDEIERVGRLKRFLPSAVADTVMSSGSEEVLESHRAMLGVLFCDIRGFTAFCETAEPEETIEVLQTYHEEMGKLINAHGAGVDLKMGDGIMVLFNDPIPCDDPAGAALRTAMAMRERMVGLCGDWRKLGHRLGFGVGVSLGYATVGMVGFEGRYDYTASGWAVNLASRLCDQAADQEILLSRRAATALEDMAVVASAGELTLKGFHAPVDVFRFERLKETQ